MAGTGFLGMFSNAQSGPWTERPEYDESRYQYGGRKDGAAIERANLYNRQADAEGRAAPQMQGATMNGAQLDQRAANETRGIQMGSLAGLSAAADGRAPSKSEILGKQMADRSARARVSSAGTVRGGPGAQASAFRAVNQSADANAADANASIQAGRADEMATARGQLAGAASGVRGQDITAATTNANLAQDTAKTNAGFTQDTARTNLGAKMQQTGLNDARAQQYEQIQNKVGSDQLQSNVQQQQTAAQVRMHTDELNTRVNMANADKNKSLFDGAIGAVGSLAGAAVMMSDPETKVPISGSLAGLGLGGEKDKERFELAEYESTIHNATDQGHGAFMSQLEGETANARPYDRDPSLANGPTGAPRGYAQGRPPPEHDSVSWSKPATWGMNTKKDAPRKSYDDMAPGTEDFERTGGANKAGETDWKDGGSTKSAKGEPGLFEKLFGGISAGAKGYGAGSKGGGVDIMTSDPKAKRAAYIQGRADGTQIAAGEEVPIPKSIGKLGDDEELVQKKDGESEIRKREVRSDASPPSPMHVARRLAAKYKAASPFAGAQASGTAQLEQAPMDPSRTYHATAPVYMPGEGGAERATFASDERTKEGFARPSTEDMADAMRSMDPAVYSYKPSYAPKNGQSEGEVNVGPMADEMAKDPVARTAVVRDSDSGMLAIDRAKADKVMMGSLASLQAQIDDLQGDVPRGDAKKRRHVPAQP